MNQIPAVDLRLREFMDANEGWGREAGRLTFQRLMSFVEQHPGALVFRVSLAGVRRVDISFASETIVQLARRYRGGKGFCFVDLIDIDQRENFEAAAQRAKQPLLLWNRQGKPEVLGVEPSQGIADALKFALIKPKARAAEYANSSENVSLTNASTKFKQLWEQGFLLRCEAAAPSGGVEYVYFSAK
ncbi:MAG: hypothetical protein QOH41_778 [Blastocatellia bacterium]|jgi:hypothetical protein|nr:hypothetical protein [Blastocatellia bacterium]